MKPSLPTPKQYEVHVLRQVVRALARHFRASHPGWVPRAPPPTDAFLRQPYYRLALPADHGELIWQPAYADVPRLPIRSLSHIMRPDIVIERARRLLILDAKFRFGSGATVQVLDTLHAYRDGLVDAQGREVALLAVAVSAGLPRSRSARAFYRRDFFRRTGLGLVHLPVEPARRHRILLTLEVVLTAFLSPDVALAVPEPPAS